MMENLDKTWNVKIEPMNDCVVVTVTKIETGVHDSIYVYPPGLIESLLGHTFEEQIKTEIENCKCRCDRYDERRQKMSKIVENVKACLND